MMGHPRRFASRADLVRIAMMLTTTLLALAAFAGCSARSQAMSDGDASGHATSLTAAVVNHDRHPVPEQVIKSVRKSLRSDGYEISEDLEFYDLLVVCTARPRSRMSPVPDEPASLIRGTSIRPPGAVSLETRWLAAVSITFDQWYGNPSEWYTLREIDVSVGSRGIDSALFSRRDLGSLWSTLDDWAKSEQRTRHKVKK